jgi:hypothetical protein
MKKILKSILVVSLVAGFASCEDEQDLRFVSPEGEFRILSPVSGEGVTLDPATPTNPGLSLTWEEMSFGTPTEIVYRVEVDKDGDGFDTPIVVTQTSTNYAVISSQDLNGAAVSAGLTPFAPGALEVRVSAQVGTMEPSYSNTITYAVTTYSTDLPKLAVPGNHQGWTPSTAPRIAASAFGETDYEGYMWLDGGFKFVAPDAAGNYNWGNTDWGDNGSNSGILAVEGESDIVAAAGYYRVKADTDALTYEITPANWGIIGSATPTSWDSDTDMTYDAVTMTWTITMDLTGGNEIKFRANDDWALNFGDDGGDMMLEEGAANIAVPTSGNYTIVLDLSNPRSYTYSLTLN